MPGLPRCALCRPQLGRPRGMLTVAAPVRTAPRIFWALAPSCEANCSMALTFSLSASATSTMWSTRSAKRRVPGSLTESNGGNNHHIETFGLIECPFDVRFRDPPVAPAVRRDKRHQIDIGFPVADGDFVEQRGVRRRRR